MSVRVYLCVYLCVCASMRACIRTCVHACMYVCVGLHLGVFAVWSSTIIQHLIMYYITGVMYRLGHFRSSLYFPLSLFKVSHSPTLFINT